MFKEGALPTRMTRATGEIASQRMGLVNSYDLYDSRNWLIKRRLIMEGVSLTRLILFKSSN